VLFGNVTLRKPMSTPALTSMRLGLRCGIREALAGGRVG
jgi:hypothetical protein